MAPTENAPWGRVDDTGTVFVREADGERAVGQYPDGSAEEALAYFERKYADLAGQVALLEQRAKGGAPAADLAKTVTSLTAALVEPNAVGDLATLRVRVEAIGGTVSELTEKQSAEAREAVDAAIAQRTAIVVEAEALAAQDPARAQWKQVGAALDALFTRWQTHQAQGPRLPKGESERLWKRFRDARATIETHRKAFFADLDAANKQVRARKQALIEKAEALAPKGAEGIPAYRALLDDWKAAGRAGKKLEDTLWARFKAAGDVLYAAKSERDTIENVEYEANLEQKLALLDEAEPLLGATDRASARATLTGIQRRWDAIGKVPRDHVRTVEERLRRIEAAVKKLDDDHWQRTDPEKAARNEGFASQLHDAIAKLEAELEAAKASGDRRRIEKAEEELSARKAWLGAIAH
ncbi:DUF349 domain-containing protein [Galbitalea sp. SE-J8]|uniref:DUF349 domain-containing protein n=1 Tax=Galbitalea sp. SE-J8 TaxID=3054952 RepID=UPI00259C96B7|nr:DUF349 domain-containing protein [Galbitalea sp. SE-J8]MDM4763244.1 DUF349 domain-containing protein [Galbitalea sp. SE-J8]